MSNLADASGGSQVGEVVRVPCDTFFPADMLLLASTHAEGIAYVETINLDGESNLKIKKAHVATRHVTADTIAEIQVPLNAHALTRPSCYMAVSHQHRLLRAKSPVTRMLLMNLFMGQLGLSRSQVQAPAE